jgi:hypothetical protein
MSLVANPAPKTNSESPSYIPLNLKDDTQLNYALESWILHEGLQSFLSMSRMEASLSKASVLRSRFSQSLARRRQRLSQPMVRSTIQPIHPTHKTC